MQDCLMVSVYSQSSVGEHTSHASEKLAGKALYLAAWEGNKLVALEKVEHTLAKQVCDYAYVVAKVEAIPKVNTFVPVLAVILRKRLQYP